MIGRWLRARRRRRCSHEYGPWLPGDTPADFYRDCAICGGQQEGEVVPTAEGWRIMGTDGVIWPIPVPGAVR